MPWDIISHKPPEAMFGAEFDAATRQVLGGGTKELLVSSERSQSDYSYIRNTLSNKVDIDRSLEMDVKKLKTPKTADRVADYHHYHKKIGEVKTQCKLYTDKEAEKLYEVLGFGHHGIAYKIKDGTKHYVVKRAFINKLKQYSISQNIETNIPEFNEILHMENINRLMLSKKSQNFPFLYNYTWCQNIDSILLFTEYFDMTLLTFFMRERSAALMYNIIFQALAAVHTMQTALKMVHNDLTPTNIMLRKVRPGGYWKYNIGGKTYYVENMGYIVIILDFGMAESEEVLNNTMILSSIRDYPSGSPGLDSQYRRKDRMQKFKRNLRTNYNLKLLFKVLHSDLKHEFLKTHMTIADYKKSKLLTPEIIRIITGVAHQRYKHIMYKSMPFIKSKISQKKILEKSFANYVIVDGKFEAAKLYLERDGPLRETPQSIKLPPPAVDKMIEEVYKDVNKNTRSVPFVLGKYFKFMLKPLEGKLLDVF